MKKRIFGFTVRDMVEIAMLCAVAILLDTFVKIQIGGEGGSANIAMVPLFIIALRHGPFKAFIAGGIVFGLITNLIDGYGFNTYPFEYLVAFGITCVLGLFGNKICNLYAKKDAKSIAIAYGLLVGSISVCAVVRFMFANFDSMMFYGSDFAGACAYNAPYVFISAAACLVITCLLLPVIVTLNDSYKTSYLVLDDASVEE